MSRKEGLVLSHISVQQENGFTLFELLIALFIGTILIMSSTYAIRIGLFSLEKEGEWFHGSTKEKAAYDFFWQQVSAVQDQKIPKRKTQIEGNEKGKNVPKKKFFAGEKYFVTFVSPLSLKKHYTKGLIVANYKIRLNDKGLWDLIYSETGANPKILMDMSIGYKTQSYVDEEAATIFLQDCENISIQYLDTLTNTLTDTLDEEDDEVAEDIEVDGEDENIDSLDIAGINTTNLIWKERILGKVPFAIKLSVTKNGKVQELVSPIMAMYSYLAYGQ